MKSPFYNKPEAEWESITRQLIENHPLKMQEIKDVVLTSWEYILKTKIGDKYSIGKDIFPKPQIMGFFLHELIPSEFANKYPQDWRKEKDSRDKDLVYIPNEQFSIEIKTSSNPSSIFGNRSYAQKSLKAKKDKSGYYLAINFEKFSEENNTPKIIKIRFGWVDHEDWMGQKSATGQQSRLSKGVETLKLVEL